MSGKVNAKHRPNIAKFNDLVNEFASDMLGEKTGCLGGGRESFLPLCAFLRFFFNTENACKISPRDNLHFENSLRLTFPSHLASRARARIGIFFTYEAAVIECKYISGCVAGSTVASIEFILAEVV